MTSRGKFPRDRALTTVPQLEMCCGLCSDRRSGSREKLLHRVSERRQVTRSHPPCSPSQFNFAGCVALQERFGVWCVALWRDEGIASLNGVLLTPVIHNFWAVPHPARILSKSLAAVSTDKDLTEGPCFAKKRFDGGMVTLSVETNSNALSWGRLGKRP